MPANSVTGHERDHSRTFLGSDEFQKEVVLALDVADLTMRLTLGVNGVTVVAVELATSKVMGKCETLGTGIAKVHSPQLYLQGLQLEVLIGR